MSVINQKAICISTPLGEMLLISTEQELSHALLIDKGNCPLPPFLEKTTEDPILQEASLQITQYFQGQRKQFTLPLRPKGSDFSIQVWNALEKIPFGSTATYGKIAHRIGMPKAARAVGGACNRNPLHIFIPCHRIIGSNRTLVGYRGGLEHKKFLLNFESTS